MILTQVMDEFIAYAQHHPGMMFIPKGEIARDALSSPMTIREAEFAQACVAGSSWNHPESTSWARRIWNDRLLETGERSDVAELPFPRCPFEATSGASPAALHQFQLAA